MSICKILQNVLMYGIWPVTYFFGEVSQGIIATGSTFLRCLNGDVTVEINRNSFAHRLPTFGARERQNRQRSP